MYDSSKNQIYMYIVNKMASPFSGYEFKYTMADTHAYSTLTKWRNVPYIPFSRKFVKFNLWKETFGIFVNLKNAEKIVVFYQINIIIKKSSYRFVKA